MSIRAMSVFLQNPIIVPESSKTVLQELMNVVKECQTKYGGKTELATEQDSRIRRLCSTWEKCLSHGLKLNSSILKNVSDMMTGTLTEPPCFWDVAYQHLTVHERERFSSLRYVWTDRGKTRALIRAALNERSMERYVLFWLNDLNLQNVYEEWALMRDDEATNLLSTIAAGLNSILFAITIDSSDLNTTISKPKDRSEPIIAAPHPTVPVIRHIKTKQKIISFDDDTESISPASSACGSVPKSLSNMCLKHPEDSSSSSSNFSILKDDETYIKPLETVTVNNSVIYQTSALNSAVYCDAESPSSIHIINGNDIDLEPNNNPFLMESTIDIHPNDSGVTTESFDTYPPTISSSNSSKHSSMHSSITSIKSSDTALVKARLQETLDRCAMLENRVAELSLENHRLRGLHKPSRHAFNYFSVSLPRVLLQKNDRRKYYAYEVHIIPTHGGDEWTVLRRYSEFYKLHKHFQKDNVAIKTLDFPPKKKFGNMDAHFVEQRRQRLQVYLRHLLAVLPEVSSCTTRGQLEQVFPFFK